MSFYNFHYFQYLMTVKVFLNFYVFFFDFHHFHSLTKAGAKLGIAGFHQLVKEDESLDVIKQIVQRQPEIASLFYDRSFPLIKAEEAGATKVASFLRNKENSVIAFHSLSQHDEAIDYLRKRSIENPDLVNSVHEAKSPLDQAVIQKAKENVRFLRESGAAVSEQTFHYLAQNDIFLDVVKETITQQETLVGSIFKDKSPISAAADANASKNVELLLNHIRLIDVDSFQTLLKTGLIDPSVAQHFIEQQPHLVFDLNKKNNKTAMELAVECQSKEIIKIMVEFMNCTKKGPKDPSESTLLHHAAAAGLIDLVHELIESTNVNAINNIGATACHLACKYKHVSVVQVIV
jgi:ankyrin repeat protein